jgi:hypothetical protein
VEEKDRWSLHVEYLKLAVGLSTAVVAAAAAIYVDESKIPADGTRYWLAVGLGVFLLTLVASVAGIGLFGNHFSHVEPLPPIHVAAGADQAAVKAAIDAARAAHGGLSVHARRALHATNVSFATLLVAVGLLAVFVVLRTLGPTSASALDRAIRLASNNLNIDTAKGETAALRSADLQGDKYVMTYEISPGSKQVVVVTDAGATKVHSWRRQ